MSEPDVRSRRRDRRDGAAARPRSSSRSLAPAVKTNLEIAARIAPLLDDCRARRSRGARAGLRAMSARDADLPAARDRRRRRAPATVARARSRRGGARAHRGARRRARRLHRRHRRRARWREADALDAARAAGETLGPLAGVPFAVKNLFDVAGLATRAGSKINRDHAARRRATRRSSTRWRRRARSCVGALNMGEYAYDFTGENVHDGPSRNPHDLDHMSGGSSGGSGAAVAGGLGAAGARLRHQRLDPRALLALRPVRPEADLRPAVARAAPFPSSRASTISARSPARSTTSRSPTTRCRAPIRDDPALRRRAGRAGRAAARRGHRRPADRRRRRLFRRTARAGGLRGGRARRRGARRDATRSSCRRPARRARRPISSPWPRARRCISTGCASAAAISIPTCATA